MKRLLITALAALALVGVLAGPGFAANGQTLQITGATYTKWLWGSMQYDGSMYNFTTVPGEGYGDNGQGSEIELLLQSKISSKVEVNGRIHSRFNQNQWTNFGGFGGSPTNNGTGGDRGEFDPRSNQYIKMRGMTVTITPGYSWITRATIGSNDWGMYDAWTIGKIRYIDRDNGSGLLFQGSFSDGKVSYDASRISLPRLWAGYNFNTGDYASMDAAYGLQIKASPLDQLDLTGIYTYLNDIEVDGADDRFRRRSGRAAAHGQPGPRLQGRRSAGRLARPAGLVLLQHHPQRRGPDDGGLRDRRLQPRARRRPGGPFLAGHRQHQRPGRRRPEPQRPVLRHRRRVPVDHGRPPRERRADHRGPRRDLGPARPEQRDLRRVRWQRDPHGLRRLARHRPAGGDHQRRQRVHGLRRAAGRDRHRLEGPHVAARVGARRSRAERRGQPHRLQHQLAELGPRHRARHAVDPVPHHGAGLRLRVVP